jgi:hypothetical protein
VGCRRDTHQPFLAATRRLSRFRLFAAVVPLYSPRERVLKQRSILRRDVLGR